MKIKVPLEVNSFTELYNAHVCVYACMFCVLYCINIYNRFRIHVHVHFYASLQTLRQSAILLINNKMLNMYSRLLSPVKPRFCDQ